MKWFSKNEKKKTKSNNNNNIYKSFSKINLQLRFNNKL